MKIYNKIIILLFTFFFGLNTVSANTEQILMKDIQLPEPVKTGGMPLLDALSARKTERTFSKESLSIETISNILWAANGINRPDGKRTAPSAKNIQEIKIYTILPEGLFAYIPKSNILKAISKEDFSSLTGKAPMVLLYVADLSIQSKQYAYTDCGFIGQNVYLYSAANGLNTVFKADINPTLLSAKMRLGLSQEVLFAQLIGYPKNK